MIDTTLPKDVNWVHHPIIKMHDNPPAESQWEYKVWLPDWLAEWDVYGDWEVKRFNSMRDNLKKGDVLFDIGTELCWQSIIYAQYVGPENMVLIESSKALWPNIKHTWDRNFGDVPPRACYYGLFSDKTTDEEVWPDQTYPYEADRPLVHSVSYSYIHEDGHKLRQITIDDYSRLTGIIPDALTMDTEGSELLILKGAEKTLRERSLKVWVAIHDELAERDYGIKPGELVSFMKDCGYSHEHLGVDHESHDYFYKDPA